MTERLTAEDFNYLIRYFRKEAFRLEVQPVYLVEEEQDSVAEFLRGEPRPVTETVPYYPGWLDRIRQATAEGRVVARVRVLEEPPTDYQRWEAWAGRWNAEAGEDIRYLPRSKAEAIGLPLTTDWWLFDSQRLALMKFDDAGRPLGGQIVDDPQTIAQHCSWRDLAVHHSTRDAECPTA